MGLTHEQRELIRHMRSGARRAELADERSERRERGQKHDAKKRPEESDRHEDMPGSWMLRPSTQKWHTRPNLYTADRDYYGYRR